MVQNRTKNYILLIIIIIIILFVNVILFNLSFNHSNTFVLEIHLLNIKKYCINMKIKLSLLMVRVLSVIIVNKNFDKIGLKKNYKILISVLHSLSYVDNTNNTNFINNHSKFNYNLSIIFNLYFFLFLNKRILSKSKI